MEDLSRLLVEERSHSEKFKANFALLKTEYDKYILKNIYLYIPSINYSFVGLC